MVTKLAGQKDVGMAMGGWVLSIAMATMYVAGLMAVLVSGGGAGAHAAPMEAVVITIQVCTSSCTG